MGMSCDFSQFGLEGCADIAFRLYGDTGVAEVPLQRASRNSISRFNFRLPFNVFD